MYVGKDHLTQTVWGKEKLVLRWRRCRGVERDQVGVKEPPPTLPPRRSGCGICGSL